MQSTKLHIATNPKPKRELRRFAPQLSFGFYYSYSHNKTVISPMSAQIDNSQDRGDRLASEQWFICKRDTGICEIVKSDGSEEVLSAVETWGAFASQGEAISKRVGLIRAGKCKPQ